MAYKQMRLTNGFREQLEQALLAHKFGAQDLALKIEENDIARLVHRAEYTYAEYKVLNDYPHMFVTTTYRCAIIAGRTRQLSFRGLNGETISVACSVEYRYGVKSDLHFEASSVVGVRYEKLMADRIAAKEQMAQASASIQAALNNATTTKALVAAWPECEPFLPREDNSVTARSLPVVQIDRLNKMLDLLDLPVPAQAPEESKE